MSTHHRFRGKDFIQQWIIFHLVAWIGGFAIAVILSELLINPWHPKETNVLLGLGWGLSYGFTQWRLLRKPAGLTAAWLVATALGLGIPFGALVLAHECGYDLPAVAGRPEIAEGVLVFLISLFVGLIQASMLKKRFAATGTWILASGIAWTLALSTSQVMLAGMGMWLPGLILGTVLLWPLGWGMKEKEPEQDIPGG